jgi:hypothetical protein
MDIQSAQYIIDENGNTDSIIKITHSDGTISFCPSKPANRHYAEIMRQVEAGELTIIEAE